MVISKGILLEFGVKHADSIDPLNRWYSVCKNADWSSFSKMKSSFNSVDAVGNDRYVFNIKGNNYRIVAIVFFDIRTIFIRFVGTHKDYEKIDCSTV